MTEENISVIDAEISRMKAKIEAHKPKTVLDGLTPEQCEAHNAYAMKLAANREASDQREKAKKVTNIRFGWNAPKRQVQLEHVRRDASTAEWTETESKLKAKLGTGFTVALIGVNGCGKTQLAVECMKTATEQLKFAYYNWASGFFIDIRGTFKTGSLESEKDVLEKYAKPKLLVVDEFEKRSSNDWEQRLLFHLLDRRYADMTDTIIIANCSPKEFTELVGPSVTSRMSECGGITVCNWKSFRGV